MDEAPSPAHYAYDVISVFFILVVGNNFALERHGERKMETPKKKVEKPETQFSFRQ